MFNRDVPPLPYRDFGGCRVGKTYYFSSQFTFPLAQLSINTNRVELTVCWLKKYIFIPGDILNLEYFTFFGKSIQIVHKREDYPKFITYGPFNNNIHFWIAMFNQAGFNLPENKDK
jgi:hypothetical protein